MDYKDTLNLPKTDFPMKANLAKAEPEMLARWAENGLYDKLMAKGEGKPTFILHDGPPYANGHIHMGHAINKVLKDIIVKARTMSGFHSPYVPGWDCHGLPIEHQVDKKLKKKKQELTKSQLRKMCRTYAEEFIDIQREEFKRLAVFGKWDDPYLTMTYGYEAQTERELAKLMDSGDVYVGKKPVYWCISCRTALAEAEVEYADKKSPSIYVKFPMVSDLAGVAPELAGKKVSVVIWTTTPWTIPSNLAVALHPDFDYSAFELPDGEVVILAKRLAPVVFEEAGIEGHKELCAVSPARLERLKAKHPLLDKESLLILGDHVTLEAGTGCVHTAPGHGQEDFEVGRKYGLDAYAPLGDDGRFLPEMTRFAGIDVFAANPLVVEALEETGALLNHSEIKHSYPHCWRCKKPVIFRSTKQWFISMEKTGLRAKALEEIDKVQWVPSWGRDRIHGMIAQRPDWCISRQRSWGVPIVAASCTDCQGVLISGEMANKAADAFEKEGADAWFDRPLGDFLPEGAACPDCGSNNFKKVEDILDVWFDSGTSHAAVVDARDDLVGPADLYLEGSDQHRGWFHSSLLASVGTNGAAPYRSVLTHGFVVDGNGRAMSKSVGNVIAPEKIIKQYGAEVVRLWVAAEDYRDDIRISNDILKRLVEAYRKIRNTWRFILGNLADFDPAKDAVQKSELWEIDRYILDRCEHLTRKCVKAYEEYEFHSIFHRMLNFCTVELSNFYMDILKDRLYTFPATSPGRRAAQTTLHTLLDKMTRVMAPILAFTTETVWDHMPGAQGSIHLADFPTPDDDALDEELAERWDRIRGLRALVTKAAEEARVAKIIGHSLDAKVTLHVDGRWEDFLTPYLAELPFLFIVSQVELSEGGGGDVTDDNLPGVGVSVASAEGEKCQRCWNYSTTVGENADHPEACSRCVDHLG